MAKPNFSKLADLLKQVQQMKVVIRITSNQPKDEPIYTTLFDLVKEVREGDCDITPEILAAIKPGEELVTGGGATPIFTAYRLTLDEIRALPSVILQGLNVPLSTLIDANEAGAGC